MSHPAGQRVAPGRRRDTGLGAWLFAQAAGRVTGTEPPKLFLTLGRTRGLFWGWLHFAGRLMPGGTLPRREAELVILRVAAARGCDYELVHHRRLARRAGVTPEEIEAVTAGSAPVGRTARERTILEAVDSLVANKDLDDGLWSRLRAQVSEREAVELCLLAGHYDMLATTITALRIAPDASR